MNLINKNSRIAVVGNLCQVGYLITKALRKTGYVNTELYITCKNNYIKPAQDPRHYENSGELPDWVKTYNTRPAIKSFARGMKIFRNYDLVIALTLSPAYVQFFNKNFIAVATGSDIREFVFQAGVYNWLLKRAYKRARHIFYMTAGLRKAVRKLGLENKASFLPHPFFGIADKTCENGAKAVGGELRIFWPSSWVDIKGVDKFVRACSDLFDDGYSFALIAVDHSDDDDIGRDNLDLIKNFIRKYPGNVAVIPKIIDKSEMVVRYLDADLVADQFILGDVGMIDLEAMSLGKPVLDYFNSEYRQSYGGEAPPVINVFSSDDIKRAMRVLLDNGDFRHRLCDLGKRGQSWVGRFHDWRIGAAKIIGVINEL